MYRSLGFVAATVVAGTAAALLPGGGETLSPSSEAAGAETLRRATFAGGCFWCMEPPYDRLDGVVSTTSGYAGGDVEDPSYEAVASGRTGHRESMQVVYDPDRVSYEELLEVFWRNVDPTDAGGQFCDRGHQYTTAIYYHDAEQRELAEASKRRLQESGRFEEPIVTPVESLEAFWPAEEYHQDFYREHPVRYKVYRFNCGRDRALNELWGEEAGGPGS